MVNRNKTDIVHIVFRSSFALREGVESMKIGVIGTGNMGTILIEAWLETKTVKPSDLIITNRTPSKALALQKKY